MRKKESNNSDNKKKNRNLSQNRNNNKRKNNNINSKKNTNNRNRNRNRTGKNNNKVKSNNVKKQVKVVKNNVAEPVVNEDKFVFSSEEVNNNSYIDDVSKFVVMDSDLNEETIDEVSDIERFQHTEKFKFEIPEVAEDVDTSEGVDERFQHTEKFKFEIPEVVEDVDTSEEVDERFQHTEKFKFEIPDEVEGMVVDEKFQNTEKFKFEMPDTDLNIKENLSVEEDLSNEEYIPLIDENEPFEEAISDVDGAEKYMMENKFPVSSTLSESLRGSKVVNNEGKKQKLYLSFEVRVVMMLIAILLLFIVACGFIFEAVSASGNKIVHYDENSSIDYKVCVKNNEFYDNSCLDSGMKYLSLITDTIPTTFEYNVNFSTAIDYSLHYRVVGTLKVVDREDESKVFYTTEDVLVQSTEVKDLSDGINFTTNVDIPYKDYNNFITEYKNKYSLDANAYLDVVLYLDENIGERAIASMNIPLGVNTYSITEKITTNENKSVQLDGQEWNTYSIICAALGVGCILFSLIFVIKLSSLVSKVVNNKNEFQKKLSQILREYDNVIVIARDGYETNEIKQMVKVENFHELVDARNTLGKPIIYVRINDVKSEFYVEDDEKIYYYVMKEADFRGK